MILPLPLRGGCFGVDFGLAATSIACSSGEGVLIFCFSRSSRWRSENVIMPLRRGGAAFGFAVSGFPVSAMTSGFTVSGGAVSATFTVEPPPSGPCA